MCHSVWSGRMQSGQLLDGVRAPLPSPRALMGMNIADGKQPRLCIQLVQLEAGYIVQPRLLNIRCYADVHRDCLEMARSQTRHSLDGLEHVTTRMLLLLPLMFQGSSACSARRMCSKCLSAVRATLNTHSSRLISSSMLPPSRQYAWWRKDTAGKVRRLHDYDLNERRMVVVVDGWFKLLHKRITTHSTNIT